MGNVECTFLCLVSFSQHYIEFIHDFIFLSFFLVDSFSPQIFTEHLLYTKHYARHWGRKGNESDKVLALLELT